MKAFRSVIVFIVLFGLSFLAGRATRQKLPPGSRVDTVVVVDTVRDTVLVPGLRYLVRTDTVLLHLPGDTVRVAVEVPFERKIYQTGDYRATVEGFLPSLVDMEIYRQTHYITKTETLKVPDRRRWGIGVQAGYGYIPSQNKLYPYVGVGVQYSIITW